MSFTPPRALFGDDELRDPQTPAPQRARVNNLNQQVDRLVREKQNIQRKASADQSALEETINKQKLEMNETKKELSQLQAIVKAGQKELERCKAEGDGMREELNMVTKLHQQKALLALAEEQLHVVELEQQLVQAQQARVMRDHKIALFQAREADLLAELADKVQELDDVETTMEETRSNMKRQLASKSSVSEENAALQSQIEQLEASVRGWKTKEKEARSELDGWLKEEKSKDGVSDKERRELQKELRSVKVDLQQKTDEAVDLQEELSALRDLSKEREKQLKAKLRAAERGREDSVEVEPEVSKRGEGSKTVKNASPEKAKQTKAKARKPAEFEEEEEAPKKTKKATSPKKAEKPTRKVAPAAASDEEVAPAKSPRKPKPAAKATKQPLADSSDANVTTTKKLSALLKGKTTDKRKSPEPEAKKAAQAASSQGDDDDGAVPVAAPGDGEKKKKRKFGLKAAPAFQWDPIEGSGTGVIPSTLSPMKFGTKGMINIPRAGLSTATSSRALSKFL